MTRQDLTGQTFGRWTVLGPAPNLGACTAWYCRCSCGLGTVRAVRTSMLRAGKSLSCGCLQRTAAENAAQDLTGRRFGRLTVLRRAPLVRPGANGERNGWLCRCDCGNTITVRTRCLKSGDTASCGCLQKDLLRADLPQHLGLVGGTSLSLIASHRPNKNNKSGVRGVYWSSREGRYIAKLGLCGKTITLGRFARLEDAARARAAAENRYYAPLLQGTEEEKNE